MDCFFKSLCRRVRDTQKGLLYVFKFLFSTRVSFLSCIIAGLFRQVAGIGGYGIQAHLHCFEGVFLFLISFRVATQFLIDLFNNPVEPNLYGFFKARATRIQGYQAPQIKAEVPISNLSRQRIIELVYPDLAYIVVHPKWKNMFMECLDCFLGYVVRIKLPPVHGSKLTPYRPADRIGLDYRSTYWIGCQGSGE